MDKPVTRGQTSTPPKEDKTNPLLLEVRRCNFCVLKYYYSSLVPRPFPPPVFDCLWYEKMEEEGLGDLVMCNEVR